MICVAAGAEALGQGGKYTVEWVATLVWNQWQFCRGISGNFRVESVASLPWNGWQLSRGIRKMPLHLEGCPEFTRQQVDRVGRQ